MKIPNKIIVILSLALCFVATTSITAQTGIFRDYQYTSELDTLVNTETATIEFGTDRNAGDWPLGWTYSINFTQDSISGVNNGTASLQVSNSAPDEASPVWITIDSDALDGTSDAAIYEGVLYARRIRLTIAKTGTGRGTYQYWASFKKTGSRL